MPTAHLIAKARQGHRLERDEALALAESDDLAALLDAAASLRDAGHGACITFSPKVFIPLTQLCRDVCHYCTFAQAPREQRPAFLSAEQVLDIARAGAAAGCHEALFTLGDKPELRYDTARRELDRLGYASTLAYLAAMARLVFEQTGLLPHLNPGVLTAEDVHALRQVSVSQGLMLESSAARLCARGGPHFGSPDKHPAVRLATLEAAGAQRVPFTSGILIGIGETRRERVEALLALRDAHARHGHLQEVIVQNFRRKPGTRMAQAPEPDVDDQLWTVAVARLLFGAHMSIQAPPNLRPEALPQLIRAGINDWGGVSPVTPDHVNPEAPWPHLELLGRVTASQGKELVARLALYPAYVNDRDHWVDPALHRAVLDRSDACGYARTDPWSPGADREPPPGELPRPARAPARAPLAAILARAGAGRRLGEAEIVALFAARGRDYDAVCAAADELRAAACGDTVSYIVNRNINYTNICYFKCRFCAFSKGRVSEHLREAGYDLPLEEIRARTREAWTRGAVEVCLQGGIHPDYTGRTYLDITRAVKAEQPAMHVHAFSPLEIAQGAKTLGLPVAEFLAALKEAGLGTLPGTAAEILDDEVRRVICPDKLSTEQWLDVVRTAHRAGLRTTATIMFGHVDAPVHWARHLLRLRDLQAQTGGFTEFVPLPYVHMESPLYRRRGSRRGPTVREAVLMHAVARLALHPLIGNIQTSWVKMGASGARACLHAGVNDLGGTLMNESISRAAGASHGQEMTAPAMEALIRDAGRTPRPRTTLYGEVPAERRRSAAAAGAEPDTLAVQAAAR